MSSNIRLESNKNSYTPGERISGVANWHRQEHIESIEIRLFYHTEGKGTTDVHIVESLTIPNPPLFGTQRFDWNLPPSPYSFSGKLISLLWGVEMVFLPSGEAESCSFQMSPTGKEILLHESAG